MGIQRTRAVDVKASNAGFIQHSFIQLGIHVCKYATAMSMFTQLISFTISIYSSPLHDFVSRIESSYGDHFKIKGQGNFMSFWSIMRLKPYHTNVYIENQASIVSTNAIVDPHILHLVQ